jgi:hypothetical protein
MSTSTKAMTSSTSVDTNRAFWERLWRTAGIQSIGCFIIAYIIYGSQPQVVAAKCVIGERRACAIQIMCRIRNSGTANVGM